MASKAELFYPLIYFLLLPGLNARIQKQRECVHAVKSSIEATRTHSPDIYATIHHYTFEYSKASDACVIIMQYKSPATGKNGEQVQILAINAVTGQAMDGHRNVFLVPAKDSKQIEEAADFLFEKYSH